MRILEDGNTWRGQRWRWLQIFRGCYCWALYWQLMTECIVTCSPCFSLQNSLTGRILICPQSYETFQQTKSHHTYIVRPLLAKSILLDGNSYDLDFSWRPVQYGTCFPCVSTHKYELTWLIAWGKRPKSQWQQNQKCLYSGFKFFFAENVVRFYYFFYRCNVLFLQKTKQKHIKW